MAYVPPEMFDNSLNINFIFNNVLNIIFPSKNLKIKLILLTLNLNKAFNTGLISLIKEL